VIVQDVRGRYASDGEFIAYQNEGRDGFDTIEWRCQTALVRRKRRNLRPLVSRRGAMARRGGKSTAPESHGAGHDVFHAAQFFYSGGVFDGSWLEWIWMNIAPDLAATGTCWPTHQRRSCGLVEARAPAAWKCFAVARLARSERCNAVLLRLAGASTR